MKLTFYFVILTICCACTKQLPVDTRDQISLAGKWGLLLDTASTGFSNTSYQLVATDSILLPGTTDIGKKGQYNADFYPAFHGTDQTDNCLD